MYIGGDIVRDGLVLHLDAGSERSYPKSGTVWKDLSGNGYDFINYQSVFNTNYFEFDGVDDNLYKNSISTTAPKLSISTDITIESIFYPFSTIIDDTSGTIIRCGLGTDIMYGIFVNRSSRSISYQYYDGSFKGFNGNNNKVNLNAWNSVIFTKQANNGSIYVNGVLDNSVTNLTNPSVIGSSIGIGATRAGTSVGSTGIDLLGRISLVKIYNRALTADEVEKNYNTTRKRFGL